MKVNHFFLSTFVLKRNFSHVHFFDKLKPLRIGPYILDRLSDVSYELLSQDGSMLHVHKNHLIPYYPKRNFCTHIAILCPFLTQPILTFQNQLNMEIVTLPLLILMNPNLTNTHRRMIQFQLNCQNP